MKRHGDHLDEEQRRLLAEGTHYRQQEEDTDTDFRSKDGDSPRSSSPSSSSAPSSPSNRESSSHATARSGVVRTNHAVRQPRSLNGKHSDYGSRRRRSDYEYANIGPSSEGYTSSERRLGASNRQTMAPVAVTTTSWQTRLGLGAILLAVTLERICFYALTGNLVLFLNKNPYLWESYHAMNALFLFFGITYIMSIVGGWLADSFMGRFRTMVLSYVVYMLGYGMLPFMAEDSEKNFWPHFRHHGNITLPAICGGGKPREPSASNPFSDNCSGLVYIVLVVIAMGSGALKANMCPFGSDQLPRASQNTQFSFFNWYYWCINCGSFIGLGLMSFLEQQYSFRLAFMVCATTLLVSVLVFCIGRLFYTCRAPDGSVLTNIFKILREAFRRWRQRRQTEGQTAPPLTVATEDSASNSTLIKTNRVRRDGRPIHFLDYAKHQHGGIFHSSLVDDVKKLGMIITVFAVLIPYWIVYFQMQTTFLFQGLHMRLDFYGKSGLPSVIPLANLSTASPPHANSHHFPNQTHLERPQIVAAWFSLFDAVFVIIMLPLFDRVIYPRLKQAGRPFTFTMRIVVGMVFAMTAILVAGVVEHYRLKAFWPYPDMPCTNASIPQFIAGTKYDAANMSVFWQIPQYALIGVSEVFTSVACLQFAVSVSPKSMKALITGIFYCFCGIGSFLGTAVLASLAASKTWIYSHNYGNINCRIPCHQVDPPVWEHSCHLDYYFYSLAGLEAVAIVLFIIVAGLYKLSSAHLVINANSQVTADDEDSQRRRRHIQVVSARGSMERQAPS